MRWDIAKPTHESVKSAYIEMRTDRIVKKIALVTLLCVLSTLVKSSIVADLQNEELSYVDVFHRSLNSGLTIQNSVIEAINAQPEEAAQIVSAAVVVTPGSISEVIEAAISVGARAKDITPSCRTILTIVELEEIVTSSLAAGARPEPILRICLFMLPEHEISRVISAALNSSSEIMHERILLVAFNTVELMGMDGLTLVAEGFLSSNSTALSGGTTKESANLNLDTTLKAIGDIVGSKAFSSGTDFTTENSKENTESPVLVDNIPTEPPSSSS
jgi:hypothetical protein